MSLCIQIFFFHHIVQIFILVSELVQEYIYLHCDQYELSKRVEYRSNLHKYLSFRSCWFQFLKLSVRIVILSLTEFQFSPRTFICDLFISSPLKTLLTLVELDFHSLRFMELSLNFSFHAKDQVVIVNVLQDLAHLFLEMMLDCSSQ